MILSTLVVAGLLLVAGAPRWAVAGVIVAGIAPPVVVVIVPVAIVAVAIRTRRRVELPPVSGFVRAVADDLAGGRTFVQAVTASGDPSVDDRVRRLCSVGVDGPTVAAANRNITTHG